MGEAKEGTVLSGQGIAIFRFIYIQCLLDDMKLFGNGKSVKKQLSYKQAIYNEKKVCLGIAKTRKNNHDIR